MKLLDISLHIGSRDLQHTFEKLGHQLDVWSISDHHAVHGWPRAKVDIVNQYTWRNLNPKMCDDFYARYKEELKKYDAFVTFYPISFSLLYEKFQKPIISYNALRYELPFMGDPVRWNWLTDGIRRMIDSGQMLPAVNDKLDRQYFQNYVERDILLVPSLCEYTGLNYVGDWEQSLYCSKFKDFLSWSPNILLEEKRPGYRWEDLVHYKSLVYIPYVNITMSIFEQYMANIPMFFPTHEFLVRLWDLYRNNVMSELSHRKIFGLSSETPKGVKFSGIDLNDYNNEDSFIYWSSLSEFYDESLMPHIQHFDSPGDLEYKLNTVDFALISAKMKEFNAERRKHVYSAWEEILKKVK